MGENAIHVTKRVHMYRRLFIARSIFVRHIMRSTRENLHIQTHFDISKLIALCMPDYQTGALIRGTHTLKHPFPFPSPSFFADSLFSSPRGNAADTMISISSLGAFALMTLT